MTVLRLYRILAGEDAPESGECGRAVEFPSGTVVVEWRRNACPDEMRLDEPHQSMYGCIDDLRSVCTGEVERIEWGESS